MQQTKIIDKIVIALFIAIVALQYFNKVITACFFFFSRDEATLYEGVSVGPSDGRSVRNQFFFRPTRSD